MKLEYNQRNFLRLVPAALLGRFFGMRGVLREIDWEADPEVDEINDALMALPLEERQAIAVDFQAGEDSLDATAPQTCQRTGRAIANQALGTGDARSRTASAGFGDIQSAFGPKGQASRIVKAAGNHLHCGLRPEAEGEQSEQGHLLKVSAGGQWKSVADVAAHEAATNPDGGQVDSNPS